jgi:hypothetical protein
MKARLLLVLLAVFTIAEYSAAFGQKLYPVQGPAAAQTPPQVLTAKIKTGMVSESISGFVSANGGAIQGKFATVTASSANARTLGTPESYPPQPNLAFAWDTVYGQGFYLSHVLGNSIAQGDFTGDQGTVLQVEIYYDIFRGASNEAFSKGYGVAVDNKGNLYKMVW